MVTDDELAGIEKADLNELKELKVKVPVEYLINLHYLKLTESRGISEVVNEALREYFAAQIPANAPRARQVAASLGHRQDG